jgi:peptidoglycan L-alanyl-D-glutamate endopeptidase CwlK
MEAQPEMNAISQARLMTVHPNLAYRINQMRQLLDFDFEVTQALRTWPEQDAIYAQGRTTPGSIVTHAPGGFSWHNYGLAVDLVPEDITPGQPDWNLNNPVWGKMVSVAESVGLVSGAEWNGADKDTPHTQLTGRFPMTPNDEVRAIFKQGGITAVWTAAQID